ncbi:MAG: cytochrome c oxidase subunit [Acidimicrobiaceae bacterium]|nr:cytochrome c oxidase subunit [Acidimicrobiaceae bacterium]
MAKTETRPDAETDTATPAPAPSAGLPRPTGGLAGLLGTGRHRSIGRLWVGTSLVFLAVSGGIGGALGAERLKPETYNVLNKDSFAQALSLHGVGGLFLFALPILIGLATIVVPRQIGAHSIAFPRAAAAAYWTYLVGGSLVVVSYLINGGPFGGNDEGVDLFLASLALVVAALVLASICIATTVLALRVPGLTLARVPLFAWSMLVACTIWIASLGLLFGVLVLLYVDHHYQTLVFAPTEELAAWLRWTITGPQVFAAAIPVVGFVGDVVPVFARTRARMYGVQLAAIGAFGALSFGADFYLGFQHPALPESALYVAAAFALLLPLLAFTAAVAETLRGGRIRLSSPLLFAISALLMLLAGAAAGAVRVVEPFKLVGTTADSSVLHYVLGAVTIAAIGAIHYWWPHVLTRPLGEGLARLTALVLLLGVIALSLPDIINGFLDEPAGSLYTNVRDGVPALNAVSLAGGLLVMLAVVLFVLNLAVSMARRPDDEVNDPWGGHTLEWVPDASAVTVNSPSPLFDLQEADA